MISGSRLLQVLELGLVERLVEAGGELAHEERRGGRHHDVVARAAGAQLGVEDLVEIVGRVVDLDAGVLLEGLELVLGDIVGPVVDVDLPLAEGGRGREGEQRGEKRQAHKSSPERRGIIPAGPVKGKRPSGRTAAPFRPFTPVLYAGWGRWMLRVSHIATDSTANSSREPASKATSSSCSRPYNPPNSRASMAPKARAGAARRRSAQS